MRNDTEILREIENTATKFAARHIEPVCAESDHAGPSFPSEIFRLGVEAGFDRFLLPEEFGGHGMGMPELCVLVKTLARTCPGHAMVFGIHAACLKSILDSAGEGRNRLIGAMTGAGRPIAVTLPEALSLSDFDCALSAKKSADGYVLDGGAGMLVGVSGDGFSVCLAKAVDGAPVAALVRLGGTEGAPSPAPEPALGLRAAPMAALELKEYKVPAQWVIGEGGAAIKFFGTLMTNLCLVSTAAAAGAASDALHKASRYAAERYQGGRMIIDHSHMRSIIGGIATACNAASAVVSGSAGEGASASEVLSAKIVSTGGAVKACIDAVQVLGGYGYMREYGLEKLMRDAAVLSLIPFSNARAELMLAEIEKRRI
jgi:alkylation response protein AidB-like acyl-CoA dehydrogenase